MSMLLNVRDRSKLRKGEKMMKNKETIRLKGEGT